MMVDPAFAAVGSGVGKYGPLADMVKGAGFLLAATLTLSLGWMRRSGSSWVPPEEAVPKATTRFASLITAVLLALLYAFLHQPDRTTPLAIVTLLSLVCALIGLLVTIYIMKSYGFAVGTHKNWRGKEIQTVKLGGSQYTHDASEDMRVNHVTVDRLVQLAQGDLTLVFTKTSVAKIHTLVTATFLALQACGSLALGGAGLLISLVS
jgi:hypothetical protein